jgi:hypothetical protein
MTLFRKLVAVVSLAAVVLAALSPASSITLFWALVIPFLLFFGLPAVAPAECRRESRATPDFLRFQDIPSRAPPAAASLN